MVWILCKPGVNDKWWTGHWRSEMQGTRTRVNTDLDSAIFNEGGKSTPVSQYSLEEQTPPNPHLSHKRTAVTALWASSCFCSSALSIPEFLQQVQKKKPQEPGSPPCNNKSTFQTPRFKRKPHHSLVAPLTKPINTELPLPRRLFVTVPRPWGQNWLTFSLQHIFAKLHNSKDTA